ncbi:hypothetical protein D3C71_1984000 [compost metagenome]
MALGFFVDHRALVARDEDRHGGEQNDAGTDHEGQDALAAEDREEQRPAQEAEG